MQHPRPIGPTVNDAAPFSIEMVLATRPVSPRLFSTRAIQQLPLTPPFVAPAFAFETLWAMRPDAPRLFATRNRLGLQLSQTTHVPAPFGPEMVAGWHPDTPRLRSQWHQGSALYQEPTLATLIAIHVAGNFVITKRGPETLEVELRAARTLDITRSVH